MGNAAGGPGANRPAAGAGERIPRHSRRVRWFHTAVYLVTLPLMFTGWWLLLGAEGSPSFLSTITGTSGTGHNQVGFSEIVVDDLDLAERMTVPDDVVLAAERSPAVATALHDAPRLS